MSPILLLIIFLLYTLLMFGVSWVTSRKATNDTYFIGNRKSPWYIVAYGMIGASLSGVTFISVPGWVYTTQFSYLAMVIGYLAGYATIVYVLLPLYYRLHLTSIYTYLGERFGVWSHKTGSGCFIVSRVIGAAFRMYIVINVLQLFIFDAWKVPFMVTTLIFIIFIIFYTFKGGVKTIVWTDTLQTTFMLLGLIVSLCLIVKELGFGFDGLFNTVINSEYSQVIFTDWHDKRFFIKQLLGGAFIAIVMTGLDQELMQKNLSCKTLKESQRNMLTLSWILVPVNAVFLFLGAALILYARNNGIEIPKTTDDLFPTIALQYLSPLAGFVFIIGLISAAYPSADGAITSLTTAVSIDFLEIQKKPHLSEKQRLRIRYIVHFSVSALLILVILIFKAINNQAVISKLFTLAGYTYGPLLGLFAFGLLTKFAVRDKLVPAVALFSPFMAWIISELSVRYLSGYHIGFELLVLNGLITFTLLWLIRKRNLKTGKVISAELKS